jgi:hypothetical protein
VTKLTPQLTITTGAGTALYDSTIKVTAHLGSTDTKRTISIYAQLVGSGTRKLLKTAKVNGSGNLIISYPDATRNVIFTATFSGDAKYLVRPVSARVGVDVRVSMSERGWCGSTKYDGATYQVFNGGNVYLECYALNLAVNFTPAKPGETLELETEQWYGNMWTTEFTAALDLSINANPMEVTLVMPPLTHQHLLPPAGGLRPEQQGRDERQLLQRLVLLRGREIIDYTERAGVAVRPRPVLLNGGDAGLVCR